jgi:hypothetical protein
MIGRLRPYWLHLALLTYTPIILVADSRITSIWEQVGLGVVTAVVLWLCTRSLPPHERWQVWLCVLVATGFEVFGSLIWGVYRYRWHNVPLYVPFGHGLVYFFGLTAAALPVFRRHGRRPAYVILGVCAAWALGGLTVLPLLTHRLDVAGALCLPVFAWCVVFSPRYAMFAAIFVATTDLELVGTFVRDWTWLARAPWDGVPSGNPPSAIAGGYSIIDGSVVLVLWLLVRLGVAPGGPRLARPSVVPDRSAPTLPSPARGE